MKSNEIIVLLQRVALFTVVAVSVLIPFFFLPTTSDFYEINKRMLIFVAAIVLAGIWITSVVVKQTIRITVSLPLLPMLLFGASVLTSSFIATSYSYASLFGSTMLILSLIAVFFFATAIGTTPQGKPIFYALSGSGALLGIISILQVTGFGISGLLNKIFGTQFANNVLFQPSGSLLATALFLLPLIIANAIEIFASTNFKDKIIHGFFTGAILAGFIVTTYFMGPKQIGQLTLLPFQPSWSIAMDTLKTSKTAMFGFGPAAYLEAFTTYRPASLNLTEFWNLRFGSARIEPLNILTTLGFVGFMSWVLFLVSAVKLALPLQKEYRVFSITLFASIALQWIFPANIVLTTTTFLLLALIVMIKKGIQAPGVSDIVLHMFALQQVQLNSPEKIEHRKTSQVFSYIIALIFLIGIGVSVLYIGKAYATESLFYKSLVAAQHDDAEKTYRIQTQVVLRAPNVDTYRRSFASTNFLIARAISRNTQATEQEKANIAPLLQQAIQEAKTATTINPKNILNWEALSQLYKELIPIAEGAGQWTIAAYVQSIQREPTNPSLRFDLASVYLGQQNYELAIRLFQQALDLKPDWANAYYNLGYAYKQKGEHIFALQSYNQALALLPPQAEDRTQLQNEIEELTKIVEKQMTEAQKKQSATETTSVKQGAAQQPSTEPLLPEGQIKIPADLGLPEEDPPTTVPEKPELDPSPNPAISPTTTPNQ